MYTDKAKEEKFFCRDFESEEIEELVNYAREETFILWEGKKKSSLGN